MEEYGFTRPRPISSTTPIGSPAFTGFLDAGSYRSASQLRPSSPVPYKQKNEEQPLLKRYKIDFTPDEPITHLATSNKLVAIATKDKKILLINTTTNEQSHCDIGRYFGSRLGQIKIYKIHLDPSGRFLLISVAYAADNQPCENLLYVKQIQQLQRLKNHLISSVAWNSSKQQNGATTTGTILLGTTKGLVLQTEFTQSDETKFFPLKTGPGYYVKEIFDVGQELGAITGISCHQINSSSSTERSFVIILCTNNRLYRMVGNVPASVDPPPLQQVMSQNNNCYKDVPGRDIPGRDLPGRVTMNSKLDLFYQSVNHLPTRYAWIAEPGVITDELYEHPNECRASFEGEMNFIKYHDPDESCLPPSFTPSGMSPQFAGGFSYYDKPISMVVSNFHVIVLMRHCIRAICILNSRIVYQEYFLVDHGEALGMTKDPSKNVIYVFFKRVIFRYKLLNENKDVWKIFLDLKKFNLAKRYSEGENLDRVTCEEAQHHFDLKEYERSAELFANSKKPFEDVCLMFIGSKCDTALRKYIAIRLDKFEPESIQYFMLLSWLLSLLVSNISMFEIGPLDERSDRELESLYQELDQLLEDEQVLDCIKSHSKGFYSIIQCYSHKKIEMLVAKRIQDYHHLVQLHVDRREYDEALAIIKAAKRDSLFYIHGHQLMKHRPKDLVDAMIDQPNLISKKIIPILEEEDISNNRRETLRYLEHCIDDSLDDTRAIYVRLFKVALNYDIKLAKKIANRTESEDEQKRLWVSIAREVLTQDGADIRMAAELLEESRILKLEDVLAFFPNCRTIGPIKAAVVRALQDKQNKLLAIRDGEYEIIANRIRNEIKTFKSRYSKLKFGQKCEICCKNIMSRTHYLFPCGHLFHYDCIITEMMNIDPSYKGIEAKLRQLAIDKERVSKELYEITSGECIHCGSLLASIIDKPPPADVS